MNLLYLCTLDLNANENLGVWKKMAAQRKVFSKYYTVSYTYMRDHHFWIRKGEKETDLGELRFIGRIYCLRLLLNYYKKMGQVPNYIYVRYTMSDWNVIKLLKYLKSKGAKTIIEIPTYPYEKECYDSLQDYISLVLDRLYRRKLHSYVEYIASYGELSAKLYGINTVTIQNGIDCDEIKCRVPSNSTETINLLMVANFAPCHGCERLIAGLSDYYKSGENQSIHFYIVGEGNAVKKYRELVDNLKMSDHVSFCGYKKGKELNDYYNLADIGVDSLAYYVKDVYLISSLKSKEYAVRGLPIIFGCKSDSFSEQNDNFVLEFPNDDSNIDVKKIVTFYNRVYVDDKKIVAARISNCAKDRCNICNTMKPIIKLLTYIDI